MLLNEVLIPILGPAFFAGLLWLALWRPWRTPSLPGESPSALQSASLSVAIGIGLLLGYLKLAGWPPFPAKTASEWMAWLAIDWAILGYGVALFRNQRVPRIAFVFVLAAATASLQSVNMFKYYWGVPSAVFWIALFGVLVVLASELLSIAARSTPGASVPVTLMVSALGLFISILLSYSAFLGQSSAMLVSMAGAAVVMSWISLRFTLAGPGVTVFYVFYLSLIGHSYFYSTLPSFSAILLVLAPFTAFISAVPSGREPRSWSNTLVNLGMSVAFSGLAVYIAYLQFAAKSQAPEY